MRIIKAIDFSPKRWILGIRTRQHTLHNRDAERKWALGIGHEVPEMATIAQVKLLIVAGIAIN